MMVVKIISGGQTGADQGGLLAGRILGLTTGGTAPPGFWTDDGCNLDLKSVFGLVESAPDPRTYPIRTLRNVQDSDGTLLVGITSSPGTRLTMRYCRQFGKPYVENPSPNELRLWVEENSVSVLNVAGNRERINPGVAGRTIRLLLDAFGGDR